jgi:phosphoenolpyruvate carboxylase
MSLRDRIASKVSKRVNHSEDLRALIDANVKEALSDMHPAVETLVREHVERLLQYVVNERVERVLGSMVEEIIHQARPTVVKDAMAMLGIVDQPVVDTPNETSTP